MLCIMKRGCRIKKFYTRYRMSDNQAYLYLVSMTLNATAPPATLEQLTLFSIVSQVMVLQITASQSIPLNWPRTDLRIPWNIS